MMNPLGGVAFSFEARERAFSAPRICTVLAGYLLRLVRDPAWLMRCAPMCSPIAKQSGEARYNKIHFLGEVGSEGLAVVGDRDDRHGKSGNVEHINVR